MKTQDDWKKSWERAMDSIHRLERENRNLKTTRDLLICVLGIGLVLAIAATVG